MSKHTASAGAAGHKAGKRERGGSHALIAESCNERQENRKRGGGKGAGAADLAGEGRIMSLMNRSAKDLTSGADLEVDLGSFLVGHEIVADRYGQPVSEISSDTDEP